MRLFLKIIFIFVSSVTSVNASAKVYDVTLYYGPDRTRTANVEIGRRSDEMLPEITIEEKETLKDPERYEALRTIFLDIRDHHKTGAPSFDCAKAKTEVEKMICADKKLGGLDYEMSRLFRYYKFYWDVSSYNAPFDNIRDFQKRWLADRNSFKCSPESEDKKECLIQLYEKNIQVFKDAILRSYLRRAAFDFRRIKDLPEKYKGKEPDYLSVDLLISEGGLPTNPFVLDYGGNDNCPIYDTERSDSNMDYYVKIGIDVCKLIDRNNCGMHGPVYPSFYSIRMDFLQNYCLVNSDGRKSLSEGINKTIKTYFGRERLLSKISGDFLVDLKTRYEILKGLVDIGADKKWKNDKGETAYDLFVGTIGKKDKTGVLHQLTSEEKEYIEETKRLLVP